MGEMADRMAAIAAAEGGDPAAQPGAVAEPGTQERPPPAAEPSTTDRGGPPEAIPYARFQEVNSRYTELRPYEQLAELGIEPDSAVRLANFEAAYMADPGAVIADLIEHQQDLPAETRAAIKTLLARDAAATPGKGAQGDEGTGDDVQLPPDVAEKLKYIDTIRARDEEADRQQRLDVVVRHWDGKDKEDGIEVPERTKLVWIQAAAGRGGYETLEQLSDAARAAYFEDRDHTLGSVVRPSGNGAPRTVPGSGAAPSEATTFKDFGAANKQILADIAAGRLPSLTMED